MTTTTPKPTVAAEPRSRPASPAPGPARRPRRAGFTLTEIMVATALSAVVLGGVISSFIFLTRASLGIRNYTDMETEARNAMETFAQDVRMSSGVTWNSATSLTLAIEQGGTATSATYSYDSGTGTFSRTFEGSSDVLITGIRSFAFNAYSIDTTSVSLASISSATNDATKQVQISLESERSQSNLALATNKVISARFVLRNKQVTS